MGSAVAIAVVAIAVAVLLLPARLPHRTGAVQSGQENSCALAYSPQAVRQRAFAFDGTVTRIGAQPTDSVGYTPVTFRVNEWFRGGSADRVVVGMLLPPKIGGIEEQFAPVRVGVRLLVSGEPRAGTGAQPLDDAVAWGCGFTRFYDQGTAAAWRRAIGRGHG